MPFTPQQLDECKRTIEDRYETLESEARKAISVPRHDSRLQERMLANRRASGERVAIENLLLAEDRRLLRDLEELSLLQAARTRLSQGSYGRCLACGEEIGIATLRLNPVAELCGPCARLREAR